MRNIALHAVFSSLFLLAGAKFASAGESASVVIADLEFKPSTITVRVGDTVTWINKDFVEHTATSRDGVFDVATPKSRPAQWRAQKVGDFTYYCRLHPNMTGTIRVTR
jgi:plastocyanin